jgi:hypothetical protein
MLNLTKNMIIFINHMPDEISYIIFLVDEPSFPKINKYSFRGARPSYGATVVWSRVLKCSV